LALTRAFAFLAMIVCLMIIATGYTAPASAARVQWFVEVLENPITKKPQLEARVLTRRGFRVHLMRQRDNSIWAAFRLPRSVRKQLTKKRLPIYWVDDFDPIDLERLKELEVGFKSTLYKLEGKQVDFIVWGAAVPGFIPPVIRQMMLGETLYVKYWTQLGDEELAEISLRRANEAIAQFLKVQPLNKLKDTVQGEATSFENIAKRYSEICEDLRFGVDDRDFTECRDQYIQCSEAPEMNTGSLKVCLNYFPNSGKSKDASAKTN
jgi:hypothetical protein